MRLTLLPLRQPAYVDSIDWGSLPRAEGQRLREFGIVEGASVEALHHGGLWGKGPIACKIGRMTVAMRRNHAAAIEVRTGPDASETPSAEPPSAEPAAGETDSATPDSAAPAFAITDKKA